MICRSLAVLRTYDGGIATKSTQLAVRGPDGTVERFGTVVTGGPDAGFHSPRFIDPQEAARFVRIALRPGALISNGERRNRTVRDAFLACVRREG